MARKRGYPGDRQGSAREVATLVLNWCYVDLLRRHEEEGLAGEP